jgi:hypothetical protein
MWNSTLDSKRTETAKKSRIRVKVSKLHMAYQWRIRSLVTGSWAKELDILDLKISSWTAEQGEAWISNLPETGNRTMKTSMR